MDEEPKRSEKAMMLLDSSTGFGKLQVPYTFLSLRWLGCDRVLYFCALHIKEKRSPRQPGTGVEYNQRYCRRQ